MIDLIQLYKQIEKPNDTESKGHPIYAAFPVPKFAKYKLAKDSQGFPSLLIATSDSVPSTRPVPVKLEHLIVLYDVNCRISHNNDYEESLFTVICCREQDVAMQEYFLRVTGTLISVLGENPSREGIANVINKLVELFRAISNAPLKSVQGLWAELFVISLAQNPTLLVKAWHQSPLDKYDFNDSEQRIEVKSATSRNRKHSFSLEQLTPPSDISVVIASVFVERVGTGISVVELAELIRSKIKQEPELLFYIDQIIGLTLGNNWQSAAKDRFDYDLAKKSLAFYDSEMIPKINSDIPKEVTGVRFQVDLTDVPVIDKKMYKAKGGIFKVTIKV